MSSKEKSELKELEAEKKELQKDIDETSKLDEKSADKKNKGLTDRLMELVRKTEALLGSEKEEN